jgi:guanylate kinase
MSSTQAIQFQRRGLLMVISAPSGGGKSAALKRLLEMDGELGYSVSVTSRSPREAEVDGKDYHFVSREEFQDQVSENRFYEWAEVHGNLYGTREDTVQAALNRGQDVVLDIDVQGGISVKWRCPESVLVFLMPPSIDVLEKRLRGREMDSEDDIRLRMDNARSEIQHWRLYDYVIINEDLDETVEQIGRILEAERTRATRLLIDHSLD